MIRYWASDRIRLINWFLIRLEGFRARDLCTNSGLLSFTIVAISNYRECHKLIDILQMALSLISCKSILIDQDKTLFLIGDIHWLRFLCETLLCNMKEILQSPLILLRLLAAIRGIMANTSLHYLLRLVINDMSLFLCSALQCMREYIW